MGLDAVHHLGYDSGPDAAAGQIAETIDGRDDLEVHRLDHAGVDDSHRTRDVFPNPGSRIPEIRVIRDC